MDPIVLLCANCDARLGSLANLWIQIGKKYITPAALLEETIHSLKVTASGAIRSGEAETLIAGCGQVIFRVSSITLKSSDQRRSVEAKIQRVLKLRGESSQSHHDAGGGINEQTLDMLQMQTDLAAQRREMQRIGATGFQVMSSFETAMARFEQQMKRLGGSVDAVRSDEEGTRRDLDCLRADLSEVKRGCQMSSSSSSSNNNNILSRLDAQLQTTDKVVAEMRQAAIRAKAETASVREDLTRTQQELRQVREENAELKCDIQGAKEAAKEGISTVKLYAGEVASLKRELKQLRAELLHSPTAAAAAAAESSLLSSHQLDILASNISKIGHRASQVESLQMEFELFRTRVQRLEAKASSSSSSNSNTPLVTRAADFAPLPREQGTTSQFLRGTRQKRPSMGAEDPLGLDTTTPAKRLAVESDAGAGEEQPSSPRLGAAESDRGKSRRASSRRTRR